MGPVDTRKSQAPLVTGGPLFQLLRWMIGPRQFELPPNAFWDSLWQAAPTFTEGRYRASPRSVVVLWRRSRLALPAQACCRVGEYRRVQQTEAGIVSLLRFACNRRRLLRRVDDHVRHRRP